MSENRQKDTLIALSSLILVLAALGVNIYSKIALEGLRPVTTVKEAPEKVRVRLWQDPFAAVMAHLQSGETEKEVLATEVCPLTSDPAFLLEDRAFTGALRQRIASVVNDGKVTILGIMVVGSPYAEDIESRLRQRLAVSAALERLGYVPEDPEFLNFIRLATTDKLRTKVIRLKNILPYEWLYRDRNPKQKLLLLWLNEDSFDEQPLIRLACIQHYLHPPVDESGRQVDFIILGPATSGMLLTMIADLRSAGDSASFPKGMRLYAPFTTVSNVLLHPLTVPPFVAETPERSAVVERQAKDEIWRLFFERGEIIFNRTIPTDQQLAVSLVAELQNRGLDLTGTGTIGKHQHHLVLISEYDTFYGRSLPEIFTQALRQKHNEGRRQDDPAYYSAEKPLPWVLRYSYLRGLDGVTVGAKEEVDFVPTSGDKKGEAQKMRREEPMGRNQYDYLRRLADTVYQRHLQLWHDHGQEIRAIGILGSDFYDKYLVLQAFKQRFPDAIFFTTDLDARYTHDLYNEWTRNLIVASGYGLTLPPDIQGDVPPFRDGYQTSVFLTVLQAVEGETISPLPRELVPHLYEIGRTQAVDLAQPVVGAFPWRLLLILSLPLWTFVGLIWFGCGITPQKKWQAGGLLAVWTFLVVGAFLWHRWASNNPGEEPWMLLEGVSVLPSNLLRALAAFGAWFFIIQAWTNLWQNAGALASDFDLTWPRPSSRKAAGMSWWSYGWGFVCRRYQAKTPEAKFDVKVYWERYLTESGRGWTLLRVIILLFLWLMLSFILIRAFGLPHEPVRGQMSAALNQVVRVVAVISALSLTFFVFDATRLFRNFILQAVDHQPTWTLSSYQKVLGETARPDIALADWMFVRFMAQRSEVVMRLIYYPFIIFFLLLASRWSTFDNWRLPIGLAIVISLSLVLAWSCALMLRRGAERVRSQIVQRLTQELVRQQAAQGVDTARVTNLRFLIEEVKSVRQGAFSPFLQNPVVQALFVPFGGIGGLSLLDFLNRLT